MSEKEVQFEMEMEMEENNQNLNLNSTSTVNSVTLYWSDDYHEYYYINENGQAEWVSENEELADYIYSYIPSPSDNEEPNYIPRENLTVHKVTISKLICISQTKNSYLIKLSKYLFRNSRNHVVNVQVKQAIIPNSFVNVPVSKSTIICNEKTITIPPQNYTCNELCQMLTFKVCEIFGAEHMSEITFIYDQLSGKCTLSSQQEFTINFLNLGGHLGFQNNTVYSTNSGKLQSPYIANVSGTKIVQVRLKELEHEMGNSGIVEYIPIQCGPITTFQNDHIDHCGKFQEKSLHTLSVQLLDEDGELIDCQNTRHTIVWQISYTAYKLMS